MTDPASVEHDPRNPIMLPAPNGFEHTAIEYPFPFWNAADGRFYAYYLGRGRDRVEPGSFGKVTRHGGVKQTGLLVSDGDFGKWARVRRTPVIASDAEHEEMGSAHASAAVVRLVERPRGSRRVAGDTIHIVYTGESAGPPVICHATARAGDPAVVTKDPGNPVFKGTGQAWESHGVREAELFRGPEYYHIFYGGYDGRAWRIGHVRTRDFRTFEANPRNPILSPAPDPDAWDSGGLLTPQVFEAGGFYYMLYAGMKGGVWLSGLARTRKPRVTSDS